MVMILVTVGNKKTKAHDTPRIVGAHPMAIHQKIIAKRISCTSWSTFMLDRRWSSCAFTIASAVSAAAAEM